MMRACNDDTDLAGSVAARRTKRTGTYCTLPRRMASDRNSGSSSPCLCDVKWIISEVQVPPSCHGCQALWTLMTASAERTGPLQMDKVKPADPAQPSLFLKAFSQGPIANCRGRGSKVPALLFYYQISTQNTPKLIRIDNLGISLGTSHVRDNEPAPAPPLHRPAFTRTLADLR